MSSNFYTVVRQQQNADVAHNLNSAIDALKRAIIGAARSGEKQVVLNNLIAGRSCHERAAVFNAANSIVAEGGFERIDRWVGEAGRCRNASNDLYAYILAWK